MRRLLCEVAHAASRTRCQFMHIHDSLIIRRGKKRAIVAVAHKLLEVAYTLIKKKKPYEDPKVNHEELIVKRNAPRWIKNLKKYGYIVNKTG